LKLRNILAGLGVAAIVTTAAACSAASTPPDTYAPAAFGVPGYCYYVSSPAEADLLKAAGLCPSSWAPALAPLAWQESYWDYYDSPAYYNVYVPASYRTVYVQRETAFGRTYHAAITSRSRTASYRSSSGKVVTGSSLPTGTRRFGSGSASVTHGSGSLRSGSRTGSLTGPTATQPRTQPSTRTQTRTQTRQGSLRSSSSSRRSH
jgi:hypothetical protein